MMPDDIPMDGAASPRNTVAIVVAVGVVGLMVAGAVALWAHYGTAVFFETIRAGLAACFG
jgi:hypothetical protein